MLAQFEVVDLLHKSLEVHGGENHADRLPLIALYQRNAVENHLARGLRDDRRAEERLVLACHRLLVPGFILVMHLLETARSPAVKIARAIERAPAHAVIRARIDLLHERIAVLDVPVQHLDIHVARTEVIRCKACLEAPLVEPVVDAVTHLRHDLCRVPRDLLLECRADIPERHARHDEQAHDDDGQHIHEDLGLDAARPAESRYLVLQSHIHIHFPP